MSCPGSVCEVLSQWLPVSYLQEETAAARIRTSSERIEVIFIHLGRFDLASLGAKVKRVGSCRQLTANVSGLSVASMEWDVASSVNTVGRYVHTMFGHAKARQIASDRDLVARTSKYGKRMLTRQSRQTDALKEDHRNCLQYCWIKYRLVDFAELGPCLRRYDIAEHYVAELAAFLQSQNLVHCIVTNIHDEAWVITTYFWEKHGLDAVQAFQSSILDFLETDDASIISEAVSDPIFRAALMQYFAGGDPKQERNWHTLSKLKVPLNLLSLWSLLRE